MKHPVKECQEKQAEFLSKCPEEEREYHAALFRIGNASYIYQQLADETSPEKLELYYYDWLETLPPNIREGMKKKGFEECMTTVPFTVYVNERNGIGMDEWMKKHLSKADYRRYKQ